MDSQPIIRVCSDGRSYRVEPGELRAFEMPSTAYWRCSRCQQTHRIHKGTDPADIHDFITAAHRKVSPDCPAAVQNHAVMSPACHKENYPS